MYEICPIPYLEEKCNCADSNIVARRGNKSLQLLA